ncbi:MAG: hypothetical protein EXR63_05100 [Dehalococcoidia bacterium]|nr:hypothetical protein [Dehalococcoidia bacterium]
MSTLKRYAPLLAAGVAIALGVTLFSPWASSSPDGLQKVANEHEFSERAEDPGFTFIRGYRFPGVENQRVATVLAGVVGVLVIATVTVVAGMLLARRARADGEPRSGTGAR